MTDREEPGSGVEVLQFAPGEHGCRRVRPVGEHLVDVGGPQ